MAAMIARFRANPPRPSRPAQHLLSSNTLSADAQALNPWPPSTRDVEGRQPEKGSAQAEQPVVRVASGLRTEPPRPRHRCANAPPAPPPSRHSSMVPSSQDWLPVSMNGPSHQTMSPLQPLGGACMAYSAPSELSQGAGTDAELHCFSASTAAHGAARQPVGSRCESVDGSLQDGTDEGTSVEQLLHRCRLLLSQGTSGSVACDVSQATSDVCVDSTLRVEQSSACAPHAPRLAYAVNLFGLSGRIALLQ